jgi:uncharacterized protein YbcI
MTGKSPQSAPEALAERIAVAATAFQQQLTGRQPKSVSVVLGGHTLVVTLHGALSPAERALAQSSEGAAKVQELHRQLFLTASESLRNEIKRITGLEVQEAAAQIEPILGAVVQVFSSGTMVQVFQLSGKLPPGSFNAATEI